MLEEKIESIEIQMTDYYNQLASKEAQNLELVDRIWELEKEQPIILVTGITFIQFFSRDFPFSKSKFLYAEMKDMLAEFKSSFITFRDRPTHGQQLQQHSASNTSSSS